MTTIRLFLAALVVGALGFSAAPPDLQATIAAVRGDLTALPAEAALENIDGWREALQGSPNPLAREVYTDLGSLRSELTSGRIDGDRVSRLLISLGTNTQRLSIATEGDTAAGLSRLGSALVDAGFGLR